MEFTKDELALMFEIIEFYQGEQSFSQDPKDPHKANTEKLRNKIYARLMDAKYDPHGVLKKLEQMED